LHPEGLALRANGFENLRRQLEISGQEFKTMSEPSTLQQPGALEALISRQIVVAMKAHDAERTGALRLIKTALKNKSIEKRAALTQAEGEQTLASMIKQRRDSIEQFTKGNRPDLAAREQAEIVIIEEFLPKALDQAGLSKLVADALAELETGLGHKPAVKDMGPSMKSVQAKLQAAGLRADGRAISELVKKALGG
jgi:uncharacterized protein